MKGFDRVLVLVTALELMYNAAEWLRSPVGTVLRKAVAGAPDKEAALDTIWNQLVVPRFRAGVRVTEGRSLTELERTESLTREARELSPGPAMPPYYFTLLAFSVQCDPARYLARIRDTASVSGLGGALADMLFWPCEAMVILTTPLVQRRGNLRETNDLFGDVHRMAYRTGKWAEPDEATQEAARARLNRSSGFALLSRNPEEREAIAFLLLVYCGWIPLPLSGGR